MNRSQPGWEDNPQIHEYSYIWSRQEMRVDGYPFRY
jgi:hypothetical protein